VNRWLFGFKKAGARGAWTRWAFLVFEVVLAWGMVPDLGTLVAPKVVGRVGGWLWVGVGAAYFSALIQVFAAVCAFRIREGVDVIDGSGETGVLGMGTDIEDLEGDEGPW